MLIKICGLRQAADLELAAQLGANLCGFIFHPQSPRYISPQETALLPSFQMLRVGVFVNQSLTEIQEISKIAKLDLLQLHGEQDEQTAQLLGKDRVMRVIWPERYPNIEELNQALEEKAGNSAYFLLDAGKRLGGSGNCLDFDFLQGLKSPLPWFLAGGLSSDNIQNCLSRLQPSGLDINSALETEPGKKDQAKMRAFFKNLQNIV